MSADRTATASSPAQLAAWERLTLLIGVLPAQLDEYLRGAAGLNHFQYVVLERLAAAPERAALMSDVARRSEVSLSRLSHAVTRLEGLGLVERRGCDTDRRATWATLTDAGRDLVAEVQPGYRDFVNAAVLDRLTPEQTEQLGDIVAAILPESGACSG